MNQSPACCYSMLLPPGWAKHQPGCCLLSHTPRFTDPGHVFSSSPPLFSHSPPTPTFFPHFLFSLSHVFCSAFSHFPLSTHPQICSLFFKSCQRKRVRVSLQLMPAARKNKHMHVGRRDFPSEISPCPTQIHSLTKRIEIH